MGENPDCLLLSGTVVGENPDLSAGRHCVMDHTNFNAKMELAEF